MVTSSVQSTTLTTSSADVLQTKALSPGVVAAIVVVSLLVAGTVGTVAMRHVGATPERMRPVTRMLPLVGLWAPMRVSPPLTWAACSPHVSRRRTPYRNWSPQIVVLLEKPFQILASKGNALPQVRWGMWMTRSVACQTCSEFL